MSKDTDYWKKYTTHVVPGGRVPTVIQPWEQSLESHEKDVYHFEDKVKPLVANDMLDDYYNIVKTLRTLEFPMLATPKVEGVRCLTLGGGVPVDGDKDKIPNEFIYNTLTEYGRGGLDGGLTIPGATTKEITDAVMSKDAVEDFKYKVFDVWNRPLLNYRTRVKVLDSLLTKPRPPMIEAVKPVEVLDQGGLAEYYRHACLQGGDGVIIRDPAGAYVFSGDNTKTLHKMRLYQTEAARVVDAIEDPKKPGTLAGFKCYSDWAKYSFEVRRGFTPEERKSLWRNRKQYIGGKVHVKTHAGTNAAPSNPVFVRVET